MDYEKAYKAVLQTATQWIKDGCTDKERICLECVFPELRESEDERIRKGLIEALKTSKTVGELKFILPEPTREECIAYLEKQKYDRMQPIYNSIDSFESALGKAWKDYNDSGARIVDGCEDDYVECAHAKGFREGYLFGIEKQKEQKPVEWNSVKINGKPIPTENQSVDISLVNWSEEDADMLNSCISSIEEAKENRYYYRETDGDTSYDHEISWLKFLRP